MKLSHQTLSVIMITKDAERTLVDSLNAVAGIADEIIIIDSGSTDQTIAIARSFTDKVYVMDWPGYGRQKQRALDKATGDWVLSIDSDEVISPELATQIKSVLSGKIIGYQAFDFSQHLFFCGRQLKYCLNNSVCMRLFQRKIACFSTADVHESIQLSGGKVGRLKGAFSHYSYATLDSWVCKMNLYTSISAQDKIKKGSQSGVAKAIISGLFSFTKFYFLKLGFLDGRLGLAMSINEFISSYIKYMKVVYDNQEQS